MVKISSSDFKSVWARLQGCFSKVPLKLEFLDIYLTTILRVRNFGNICSMRVIVSLKILKIYIDFKNAEKNSQKGSSFWNNCIWIGSIKVSLLIREYLSSAVNVLANSLKILHITKGELFQFNYLQGNQWIWWSSCCWYRNSVLTHLPCCPWKGSLKQGLLGIYLTTYIGDSNSENISTMRVIFFWKMFKI